jgi:hypothetical protein
MKASRSKSLAQRIRALFARGLDNSAIALRLDCGEAYVRSVRQRTDSDGNPQRAPGEVRWTKENYDRVLAAHRKYNKKRYATDPEFRKRQIAATARWEEANRDYRRQYKREWRASRLASVVATSPNQARTR